jgi:hypothetical protein
MPRQFAIGAVLLAALNAAAQTTTGGPPPPRCSTAEHRQFDFWLGEWDVTQNGKLAGRNSIHSILDGCAISEQWSGTGGLKGSSLNFYNTETKRWQQTWIDSRGQSLALEGNLQAEGMVLESAGMKGSRHRITWTPMPDKTVRQFWQVQEAPGSDWKTLFDGKYSARAN